MLEWILDHSQQLSNPLIHALGNSAGSHLGLGGLPFWWASHPPKLHIQQITSSEKAAPNYSSYSDPSPYINCCPPVLPNFLLMCPKASLQLNRWWHSIINILISCQLGRQVSRSQLLHSRTQMSREVCMKARFFRGSMIRWNNKGWFKACTGGALCRFFPNPATAMDPLFTPEKVGLHKWHRNLANLQA